MDNYLSSRWPAGSPVQSHLKPPSPPPRPPKRGWKRPLLITVICVVVVALLSAASYWSVKQLEDSFAYVPGASASPGEDPGQSGRPDPSRWVHGGDTDWTPDDLPWGDPDPSVQLSFSPDERQPLSATELYQTVLPSVVCVQAEHQDGYSTGSGVVMTSTGYIITNYHIIDDGTEIEVMLLSDKSVYDAVVIGFDEELDIAVLKVEADDLTPAVFSDSNQLSVGDTVYAIGNPMGYLYGSLSDGIVSAIAHGAEVSDGNIAMIQTTAALNPGNSGGALVDVYGRVVGITSAKITGIEDEVVIEGLGLAIPITDVQPFINHILSTGESFRPGLGITCKADREGDRRGIRVVEVEPGSPSAGLLRRNDLLLTANGTPITELYELSRVLYAAGVDGDVEFTLLRGKKTLTVTVTLYDRLNTQ